MKNKHGFYNHCVEVAEYQRLARILEVADELAEAAATMLVAHANLYESVFDSRSPHGERLCNPDDDIVRREFKDTLAAYELLRKGTATTKDDKVRNGE